MPTLIRIHIVSSASPHELLEGKDSIQGTEFKPGDRVIQCPECNHWYHLDSWKYNGNKCGIFGCPGVGQIDETTPLSSLPESEVEITIIGDIVQAFDNPESPILPNLETVEESASDEFISIDWSDLPPPSVVIMPRIQPAKVGAMTKLLSAMKNGGWKIALLIAIFVFLFLFIMANQ